MKTKKKMGKKILLVIALVLTVLVLAVLVLGGFGFVGPFRGLAVQRIAWKYDEARRPGEIIFYGASNFAQWESMEDDFTEYKVQNHGFGGSTDKDLVHYADKILYPYVPSIVIFQTGSNDYVQAEGSESEKVAASMAYKEEMFSLFHEKMPDAIFIVMSGLLLPGRSEYTELTQEVNRQLALLCEETDYMVFVDATVMTYTNGAFRSALFVEDGIHLNDAGRAAWADDYIRPAIEAVSARE